MAAAEQPANLHENISGAEYNKPGLYRTGGRRGLEKAIALSPWQRRQSVKCRVIHLRHPFATAAIPRVQHEQRGVQWRSRTEHNGRKTAAQYAKVKQINITVCCLNFHNRKYFSLQGNNDCQNVKIRQYRGRQYIQMAPMSLGIRPYGQQKATIRNEQREVCPQHYTHISSEADSTEGRMSQRINKCERSLWHT